MKVAFTGDIVFWGKFDNMEENDNIIDGSISEFLRDTDYCVCDLEGPVYSKELRNDRVAIRSRPTIKHFFNRINGNILFLGNNHILDYDDAGFDETMAFAEKNGFQKFGAGYNIKEASEPLYLDDVCGLLGIRYNNKHARATSEIPGCLIWDEDEVIKKRICEIKNKCKWCVLVIHGGNEFCMTPFPEIRNKYMDFLEWGADIIVAHHPHVVQNYEQASGKMIFYSLGNFVFDDDYMRVFSESKEGVLLKLDFQENDFSWQYMPIYIDGDSAQIKKTHSPAAFNRIEGDADYEVKVRVAMKDYLIKERINLKYQVNRTDIKVAAKCRIILSHIKRYIILLKKVIPYLNS